jgi:hypothetical protein
MAVRKARRARVWVDHGQYHVMAGPEMDVGAETIPGLFLDLGPEGVAVLTGLYMGKITVTAAGLTAAPAELDEGWDVVAETDLVCPEGEIYVLDMTQNARPELGPLARAGPGRYRLRAHARNREQTEEERHSREEHHLLVWPVTEAAPPRLLTPMDEYGRIISGEAAADAPPLDAIELAAAAAMRQLASLVVAENPPDLSGSTTTVSADATVAGTRRRVWRIVSEPMMWIAMGGSGDAAGFYTTLMHEPYIYARGTRVLAESPSRAAFTYSWTTMHEMEADIPVVVGMTIDPDTGEHREVIRMERGTELVESWLLPARPTTVGITLSGAGKGLVTVQVEHRDLPVELASLVQPFWDWALRRELPVKLDEAADYYGFPWERL